MSDDRYEIEIYKVTLAVYDKEQRQYVDLGDGVVEEYDISDFKYGKITHDLSIDDLIPSWLIPK